MLGISKKNIVKRNPAYHPDGSPRHVRIWDDGKSTDRYTVQFTRAHCFGCKGYAVFLAMSGSPFWPQGVCLHNTMPSWKFRKSHGKSIPFTALPKDCQKAVMQDYKDYWGER